ncbi:MAG: response regulator [Flavobacteriales bacterium]
MSQNPARIALVDDDDIMNFLHEEMIQRAAPGSIIDVFKSGKQWVNHLQDESETALDILFLDIRMPEMDGFEVLQAMGKTPSRFAGLKIYVLSSTLDDRDLDRAKNNPMVIDFLSKPLSIDLIARILQSN